MGCFKLLCKQSHEKGSSLVLALIVLTVGMTVTSVMLRSVSFQLDRALGIKERRKQIESWEIERANLVQKALPVQSFQLLSKDEPSFYTVLTPEKWRHLEHIRLPFFKGGTGKIFFWKALTSCEKESNAIPFVDIDPSFYEMRTCLSLPGSDWANISGNFSVNYVNQHLVAATGRMEIEKLDLSAGGHFEVVAGGTISIKEIIIGTLSTELTLYSLTGAIILPSIASTTLEDCSSNLKLELKSSFPNLLKDGLTTIFGCSLPRSELFWRKIIFLGEFELKSLIDSKPLR